MKIKKKKKIFKFWLFSIEKWLKTLWYTSWATWLFSLNVLLLDRAYTKCMYMYKAIFLYYVLYLFMDCWTCTLSRGRNWKEKYFANIVYAVRKRTNHVYPDVSPSVLHHPRQETVFLIIATSIIPHKLLVETKAKTFINFLDFHYCRVCEAIAQEDAESKGKNMTKTVLNT